ncbi:MAG: Hpt domain-containing protein, partial [bacterium]
MTIGDSAAGNGQQLNGDIPEFKRRAHSLNGILACFGCIALTDRLTQLERQHHIAPELAAPLHDELQQLWET